MVPVISKVSLLDDVKEHIEAEPANPGSSGKNGHQNGAGCLQHQFRLATLV